METEYTKETNPFNLITTDWHQGIIDKVIDRPTVTEKGYKIIDVPQEFFKRMLDVYTTLEFGLEYPTKEDGTIPSDARPKSGISGSSYYNRILNAFKEIHEEWCGLPLIASNYYGPREYYNGAVLVNHVDWKKTHVISSTITLAYYLDEPWPIVLQRPDKIIEVNLAPGQMMMYEGSIIPHSRPSPMRGEYYANMYLHYKPR